MVVADLAGSPIVVDLRQPGNARRMVAEAMERLGALDVLVNDAGGYSGPTFPSNDDWRSPIELNLLSAMEAIKPHFPRSRNDRVVLSTSHPLRRSGTIRIEALSTLLPKLA